MKELPGKIARRLQAIYPAAFREEYVNRILGMIEIHPGSTPRWSQDDAVLITYGNTIRAEGDKGLVTLRRFLEDRVGDAFSCVHLLPFFPSTSDDGFAVSDYESVDPALGDWNDMASLSGKYGLMFDLVINHVSVSHPWFQNFLAGRSPGKGYFIEMDPAADYSRVVRPRSTPLFTKFRAEDGLKQVWTTFSADQVDLNFANPEVLIEMIRILLFYIKKGVRIIRLDAIAFLWKEAGTSCLHLPPTHEIIRLLRDITDHVDPGVILLTETNVPNRENWSYFGNGDEAHMVYQFTLPPLLLYTLFTGNAGALSAWAQTIPATGGNMTFLNFTSSHDGIGIRPLEGILPAREIQSMIRAVCDFGGLISEKSNPDGTVSPYELNTTYLDALRGTQQGMDHLGAGRFLCSQLIAMALQGIPGIYIQSLLGAGNDREGVRRSGRARSINRKCWDLADINRMLSWKTPGSRIFREYIRLLHIRKKIPLFHPDCMQRILSCGDSFFGLTRESREGDQMIRCISNITGRPLTLPAGILQFRNPRAKDVITGRVVSTARDLEFSPYQTRWLLDWKTRK